MKQLIFISKLLILTIAFGFVFNACNEEEVPAPLAYFTFEVDADNSFLVQFSNESDNADTYLWEFGDGETSTEENPSHEYAEVGTYTVQLKATNESGDNTYSLDVSISSNAGVEVVTDGDMSNADSWQGTALNANEATNFSFEDGVVKITNGNVVNQSNGVIYQEINVEAGDYLFSMDFTNDGTQIQTWLEVYFGSTVPVEGEDYTDGGIRSGVSAWDCPEANTNVNIIDAGCKGDLDVFNGGNGVVTFEEAGTLYLVIKAGSWDGNLTTGYIIDNVSLISQ